MLRRLAVLAASLALGCSPSSSQVHDLANDGSDGAVDASAATDEDLAIASHDGGTLGDLDTSGDMLSTGRCAPQMAYVSTDGGLSFCIDRYEGATVVIAPDG